MSLDALQQPNLIINLQHAGIAVLELNRPHKVNALSHALISELTEALSRLDNDLTIFVVVLTSSSSSSFSGADLSQLVKITTAEAHRIGWLKDLQDAFTSFRKPVLAAVRGFAVGGGLEIALMCDMIFASADARFGLPEIKLGTIPGAGGTQRLTRSLGKQKAMELILTGATLTAAEMERFGIVNRVILSGGDVLEETLKVAQTVASFSAPAVALAKQAVRAGKLAERLEAGLEIERTLYYSSFSLGDCREGIQAFLEKRPANVEHR
ncbi:ClpP/crotonase-like domain-containing protein [Pyrenochaeta sp. MPI-SDFR-AT-0127]|nr:ClpP/crotonase-like domain-containing protein [Pyrenochaeta sp. MPI-SDFR-AT-0127]